MICQSWCCSLSTTVVDLQLEHDKCIFERRLRCMSEHGPFGHSENIAWTVPCPASLLPGLIGFAQGAVQPHAMLTTPRLPYSHIWAWAASSCLDHLGHMHRSSTTFWFALCYASSLMEAFVR